VSRGMPRRSGRPPAGAQPGERVKDYPQLSLRLPPESKAQLRALSVVKALPQWRVVLEAIDCLVRTLSEGERQLILEIVKRRRR